MEMALVTLPMSCDDFLKMSVEKGVENLAKLGITCGKIEGCYVENTWKGHWGLCRRKNISLNCDKSKFEHTIYISHYLLESGANNDALYSVLYHELLHTVNGTVGHDDYWLELANKVSEAYGIDIRTTDSAKNLFCDKTLRACFLEEACKHKFICSNCGKPRYTNMSILKSTRKLSGGCSCGGKYIRIR